MSRRRRIVIVAALASFPIALFAAGYGAGLRVNFSPSYPLGLWRIHALRRDVRVGDLVFICPPLTASFGMFVIFIYAIAGIFAPVIAPHGEASARSRRPPQSRQRQWWHRPC